MSSEHMHTQFDEDLEALRSAVLQMGGLVEKQLLLAIDALAGGDLANADEINANEVRVNALEVNIDSDCSKIIARRQPTASDLRLVMAVSKAVTDLERIGDEAKKIARTSRRIHGSAQLRPMPIVGHAAEIAVSMLRRTLDAFARLDADAAQAVIREDVAIDDEFRSTLRQLISFIVEDPRTISTALEIVWTAKSIERIGDHAKNLSEHVVYIVKGTDVRHTKRSQVESG